MSNEWIEKLQPGDRVFVDIGPWLIGSTRYVFRMVERTIKTLIILDNGQRFKKATGRDMHKVAKWSCTPILRQYTKELYRKVMDEQEVNRISSRMGDVEWRKLPLETLKQVEDIVDESRAKLNG